MTSQISNVLKNASAAQDADSAAVFANILNADQHAMKTLKGNTNYTSDDASRVARIMGEYLGLQSDATRQPTSAFSGHRTREEGSAVTA